MQKVKIVKPNHTCKFKRHTYETGTKVFFCTLPKCNKKLKIGLALGKECICWRCGEVFILNEYSVRLAKPHCEDCHKSKDIPNYLKQIPEDKREELRNGNWNIEDTLPLSERLKKLTTVKEEDEEL